MTETGYTEVTLIVNGVEYDSNSFENRNSRDVETCIESFKVIPDEGEDAQIFVLEHGHPRDWDGECVCVQYLTDHHPYWEQKGTHLAHELEEYK